MAIKILTLALILMVQLSSEKPPGKPKDDPAVIISDNPAPKQSNKPSPKAKPSNRGEEKIIRCFKEINL